MPTQRFELWGNGDSIVQGYMDQMWSSRPYGLLWRLKKELEDVSNPQWTVANFGFSGATASMSFSRMKQIFLATPAERRPTAILHEIYTPNGIFDGQGAFQQARVTGPESAYAIALEAESFYAQYNVQFIPWMICMSLYNTGLSEGAWVRDNVFYPAQAQWGARFLQSVDLVQDPAVNLATEGIRGLVSWFPDGVHLNSAAQDHIYSGGGVPANSFKTRLFACLAAAGVVP